MEPKGRTLAALAVLALCLTALPLAPIAATEPAGTVFVRMPATAYRAAALPAVSMVEYGSLVWLELKAGASR